MRSPKETVLKAISEKVLRIRNPMKKKVLKKGYLYMARKKSFEEYREENLREQEKIKQQIEDARLKQLQAEHCIQRAENQIAYQRKKKDKGRVHRLITKGAAIEAICKDTQYLMESEFYELMDEVLHIPELQFHLRVADMVQGRKGIVEEE